jgi:ABC-type antimicrobial peptide transport system permease subunit
MALGARARGIWSQVVRQGVILAMVGIVIGSGAALVATRWIATQLYGVSPTDVVVFTGVVLLIAIIALLAAWLPARRASKVDPMVALRAE